MEYYARRSPVASITLQIAKRKKCGVPKNLVFQTEPELGLEMITKIEEREVVPFAWVNADEHYGMNPDFLDGVAGLDKWYFAEVPVTTMVWPEGVKILLPYGRLSPIRRSKGSRIPTSRGLASGCAARRSKNSPRPTRSTRPDSISR